MLSLFATKRITKISCSHLKHVTTSPSEMFGYFLTNCAQDLVCCGLLQPLCNVMLLSRRFFEFRVRNTRGHSYKLYQQFSNCTSRSKFFSERVVTLWNSLPGDRVNFSSLFKFKSSLKCIHLLSSVWR